MVIGWTDNIATTKYEQTATLLRQGYAPDVPVAPVGEDISGYYSTEQDPITGEIIRVWHPAPSGVDDNPDTEDIDESQFTFECQARGIMTGGMNVRGAIERWTSKGDYDLTDAVEMHVAPNIRITTRDRVTNIRNSRGEIVWTEDTYGGVKPTVFDVEGVQPSLDAFGSIVEWFVLLNRSEVQSGEGESSG